MKHLFLILALLLLAAQFTLAQLTVVVPQPTLTELVFPQYFGGTNGNTDNANKMATAFRIQINGLIPSTLYKFAAGLSINGTNMSGYFYFPGYNSGGTLLPTPSGSGNINMANFANINTDANGIATFWVIVTPIQNTTFRPNIGASHKLMIAFNDGSSSTLVNNRLISSSTVTIADFTGYSSSTGDDCAFIEGHSSAPAGKFVFIYDNTAGTGRPLHGYMVEDNAIDETSGDGQAAAFYFADICGQSGRYGLLFPVSNSNGIRRIEVFNSDGSSYNAATDDDGTWPSGVNTTAMIRGSVYIITETDAALPVELQNFTATARQNQVYLKWHTATEVNSSLFIIQRKATNDWSEIGKVNASGTSNSPKDYQFIDANVLSGKYLYRLKMIDNDGTFEFSPEQSVVVAPPNILLVGNYPNPFNPMTIISYSLPQTSFVTLKVYNILGKEVATLVNESKQPGKYQVGFDGSKLSSGTYIYRFTAGNMVVSQKIILVK